MNHKTHTPELFDRLVDGELSESERKNLLASLDQEPNGWRQCALAFLEAQSWKKELGVIRQSLPTSSESSVPLDHLKNRRPFHFGVPGTLMAMTACFLMALGIGALWFNPGDRPGSILGNHDSLQLAGKTGDGSATSITDNQTSIAQTASQQGNKETPWQWVRLTPAGAADSDQAVDLPAEQRDNFDPQWAQNQPPPISEDLVQALRRNGYKVQMQQQFMPMPLKDGRRLVVPVDNVELQYVGNKTY